MKLTDKELEALGIDPNEYATLAGLGVQPQTAQPTAPARTPNPQFIEPVWMKQLELSLMENGALVFGPRGSGKSFAVRELARRHDADLIVLQCFANMQEDRISGGWQAVNGSTVMTEGAFARALKACHAGKKTWVAAEEQNAAHPGIWSKANNLLDGSNTGLEMPDGSFIDYHPDFRFFGLYNEGYAGMREVNQALKDRLVQVYATYPDPATESAILTSMTGAPKLVVDRVVNTAKMLRNAMPRYDISVRPLARWIKAVGAGISWEEAYAFCLVDPLGQDETAGPQRAKAIEIGKQQGMQSWK